MSERDDSYLFPDTSIFEAKADDVRIKIRQIEGELSRLKFCWFGEKRRYKAKLKAQKKFLKYRLPFLH